MSLSKGVAPTKWGFISNLECGSLPSFQYLEDGTEVEIDDFLEVVSTYLQEGEVAVFIMAGAEKARYITAFAVAINSKGERVELSLYDIYEKAKVLGANITAAEY